MEHRAPPLREVLGRLPWFADLSARHCDRMLTEVAELLTQGATTRVEYAWLLRRWSSVAHVDGKWTRFELLRESGLLAA